MTGALAFTPGGGLPTDVGYALAALVCAAFMLVPGLGLALGLGRRAEWDLAEVVGASFAFMLAVVGVVTLVGHYAGFGLVASTVACGALFAGGWVAGFFLGRGRPLRVVTPEGLGYGLLGAAVAVLERPWFSNAADTFYHLAAVRSLSVLDRPVVTDPFYRSGLNALDPTTGVWHSALAMIARVTGLDVMWLWPGATAVGAAMTLLAFWVLCRRVGASRPGAAAGTAVFFTLGLMLDMRWFGYPNRMSLALIFLALAGFAALLERFDAADVVLGVAAGFAAISLHLAAAAVIVLMGLFLGVLLVLDVLAAPLRGQRGEWMPVAGLGVAGGALAVSSLAVLLPKAGVIGGSTLVGSSARYIARQMEPVVGGFFVAGPTITGAAKTMVAFGTVLGVLAAVPAFFDNDRRALACLGIAAFPAAIFFNPIPATALFYRSQYLTWRIAILLPFAFYVAMAWGMSRWREHGWWGRVAAAAAALAVAGAVYSSGHVLVARFLPQRTYEVIGFPASRERDVRLMWGPDVVAKVAAAVGDGYPVVAGDLDTTYMLAGVMDVAVLAAPPKHAPFGIENVDGAQRRQDLAILMAPGTPESMRREILIRRDVGFVIVSNTNDSFAPTRRAFDAEPDLLERVVTSPTLSLWRVRRGQ